VDVGALVGEGVEVEGEETDGDVEEFAGDLVFVYLVGGERLAGDGVAGV
jgi:hypothetical protein